MGKIIPESSATGTNAHYCYLMSTTFKMHKSDLCSFFIVCSFIMQYDKRQIKLKIKNWPAMQTHYNSTFLLR